MGVALPRCIVNLLTTSVVKASGLCKSNSEAQSQIKNGAVKLDGEKLGDRTFANVEELSGKVLQFGKKKFLRLI